MLEENFAPVSTPSVTINDSQPVQYLEPKNPGPNKLFIVGGVVLVGLIVLVGFLNFNAPNKNTTSQQTTNKATASCHDPLPKTICENSSIFIVAEVEVKEFLKIGSLNIKINSIKEYAKDENKDLKDIKAGDEVYLTPWRSIPGTKTANYPEPLVKDLNSVVNKNVEVIMTCDTACVGDITKVL